MVPWRGGRKGWEDMHAGHGTHTSAAGSSCIALARVQACGDIIVSITYLCRGITDSQKKGKGKASRGQRWLGRASWIGCSNTFANAMYRC